MRHGALVIFGVLLALMIASAVLAAASKIAP